VGRGNGRPDSRLLNSPGEIIPFWERLLVVQEDKKEYGCFGEVATESAYSVPGAGTIVGKKKVDLGCILLVKLTGLHDQ
jgi:hypothetical protein